jgi:hypothetical protein
VSQQANNQAAQNAACLAAFGSCRKYQDSVTPAVAACSQSSKALTSKLQSLTNNIAAVTKARKSLLSLSSRTEPAGTRQKATTYTCADIIAFAAELQNLIEDNPASTMIAMVAEKLVNATAVATCSAADVATLVAASNSLDEVDNLITADLESVQDTLEGKVSMIFWLTTKAFFSQCTWIFVLFQEAWGLIEGVLSFGYFLVSVYVALYPLVDTYM